MTPPLAMALLGALIRKLRRLINSRKALRHRERAAALGKCPTCRDPIPGLEPVEVRPRPWTYCEECKAEDRMRKATRAA